MVGDFALQKFVELVCGLVAEFFEAGIDTGKRDGEAVAEEFDVVYAKNGYFVRNVDVASRADIDESGTEVVLPGEDAERAGEVFELAADVAGVGFPVLEDFRRGLLDDVEVFRGDSGAFGGVAEFIEADGVDGYCGPREEGKVLVASFFEVGYGEFSDAPIVGEDFRDGAFEGDDADVDGGYIEGIHKIGNGVSVAGDDAVSWPAVGDMALGVKVRREMPIGFNGVMSDSAINPGVKPIEGEKDVGRDRRIGGRVQSVQVFSHPSA